MGAATTGSMTPTNPLALAAACERSSREALPPARAARPPLDPSSLGGGATAEAAAELGAVLAGRAGLQSNPAQTTL